MAGCGQPWPALASQVLTKKRPKTFKNEKIFRHRRTIADFYSCQVSFCCPVPVQERLPPGTGQLQAPGPSVQELYRFGPSVQDMFRVGPRMQDLFRVGLNKEPRLVSLRAKYPRHVSRRAEDRAQFFVFKLELKSNTEAVLDKLGLEKIMTYWGTILQKPKSNEYKSTDFG